MVKTNNSKDNFLKLSIQVSLNGLSFCAINKAQNTIVFFKVIDFKKRLNPIEVLQQIEKVYEKEDFLKNPLDEVNLLFSNELYSIVPEKLFIEDNASDYLKFNTKILETDFVAQDHLEEHKLINVYIPYTNIINFFFDQYGEFEYRHNTSVLIEELLKLNKDENTGTKVYVNNYPSGYDLVVIENGKLILTNSFTCDTKEDFIYYLLFTAEQLELDPSSFDLVLLGDISEESEKYEIAYTYIKNISFLKTSFGFIFEAGSVLPKGYAHFTIFKSL